MPNIKSSAKRDAWSKARRAKNRAEKSALKTQIKKFDAAVAEGDKEKAALAFRAAARSVDKAAGKHLIHKNNAANKKSKMAGRLNAM